MSKFIRMSNGDIVHVDMIRAVRVVLKQVLWEGKESNSVVYVNLQSGSYPYITASDAEAVKERDRIIAEVLKAEQSTNEGEQK